ncbi:MAG: EF-hand domain-containing protein [Candidatus Poseidoniaceae archaeon]|nr:EF-hand domain-containing protein [Candidatus Poseidoniaceae archaeon]
MEPVFISVGVMVGALLLIAYYVQNGIGGMSTPMQALGSFLLVKAPAGAVDLFDDSAGRGGRTWARFGLAWLVLAGTLGFIGRWHDWDATALDSLASLGWSYDDGSGLATTISTTLRTGLVMVFIGTTLTATARTSGGRLSSEASASMMGLVFTVVSLLVLLLPTLAGLFGLDAATEDLLVKVVSSVVLHSVIGGALLVNVLITLANRGDAPVSYSSWFLLNALVVMLVAPLLYIGGELADGTQTVWLAQAALEGWLPLALMLGTAYAVIPAAAERAIWSSSLSSASLALLFLTVPVVSVRPVDAPILLENVGGILMTFGMLPLLAASVNLLQTARSGASQSFSTPAGIAGVLAMFLLPIYAVGAYFTGMETLVGEASLHGLNMSLSHGLFFTFGGLLALSATLGYLPQANGRAAAGSGGASTAVWMVALGGFLASVSTALSSLSVRAVERSVTDEDMLETALEAMAGFDLVGAFLFYGVALGFMVAASVSVRIGFSPSSSRTTVSSDIHSYALANGSTSIRSLLGRGVGLDTELIIGGEEKAATGPTVIAVRADLHNDEVTEFPESDEAVPEELQMLADFLDETDQDVFSFFRSIDLDDSGSIDARELQNALRSANIANLPPWDMGRLIAAIDIDGDGQINLPELDITVARLRSASSEEE